MSGVREMSFDPVAYVTGDVARDLVSGLMHPSGGGGGTGPFLSFPKSETTPTPAEVLEKGVQIGKGNPYIFLSNNDDVYYFRVSDIIVFSSRTNTAKTYSLYGNGTLRTNDVTSKDSNTGLYYATWSNTPVYSDVYNCESVSAGLNELAQYI
jgi:hypothetical protein